MFNMDEDQTILQTPLTDSEEDEITVVRSYVKNDEDHLVILRLGLVSLGTKMAGQANSCPEGSLAV